MLSPSRALICTRVAPHAGSVDRNLPCWIWPPHPEWVAPHAGSVDRNPHPAEPAERRLPSLPTRGAWIEINQEPAVVAEGKSLPTRGAWIEISMDAAERWLEG